LNTSRRGAFSSFTGYSMVMSAAIFFALNGSLSRQLFDSGVTPLTLVEFRMLIGGLFLFGFLCIGGRRSFKLSWRALGWVIALGISIALVTYTYFVSISRIPIAVTLVIQFTGPAWMALVGAIWRRKLPSWYMLVALALTVAGVVLVTGVFRQSLNGLDTLGLAFSVFSLLTFIAYLMLGHKVGEYLPSTTGTAYGALVASLFWLIIQPPWSIPASTWNPHIFWLVVLVGTIGMALPFSLELGGLRRLDATRAGIASMLELPASAFVAFLWLGQSLDFPQILGCALVLAGITIVQLEKPAEAMIAEEKIGRG